MMMYRQTVMSDDFCSHLLTNTTFQEVTNNKSKNLLRFFDKNSLSGRLTNGSVLRWSSEFQTFLSGFVMAITQPIIFTKQVCRLVFGCLVQFLYRDCIDCILNFFAGIVRSLWEEFALDERKGKFRGRCCTNLQSSTHHISEGRTGKIWITDISLFGWSTRPFWVKITWIVILT